MAASRRFRPAGLGHRAIQRDRQPADHCMAEAELGEKALSVELGLFVVVLLFWVA